MISFWRRRTTAIQKNCAANRGKRFYSHCLGDSAGAAVVEFAIVLNLFLVLIMGMIDFGHAWFIRQMIVNASREGARYGVVFTTPKRTSDQIVTYVRSCLPGDLAGDAVTSVQVDGAAGDTTTPLTVTIISTKTWWVINKFIPGLGNGINIQAQTIMRNE